MKEKIGPEAALQLEEILCRVYRCQRGGVGGAVDRDMFAQHPMSAGNLALSPLYLETQELPEVAAFLNTYSEAFNFTAGEKDASGIEKDYVSGLNALVEKYYHR